MLHLKIFYYSLYSLVNSKLEKNVFFIDKFLILFSYVIKYELIYYSIIVLVKNFICRNCSTSFSFHLHNGIKIYKQYHISSSSISMIMCYTTFDLFQCNIRCNFKCKLWTVKLKLNLFFFSLDILYFNLYLRFH